MDVPKPMTLEKERRNHIGKHESFSFEFPQDPCSLMDSLESVSLSVSCYVLTVDFGTPSYKFTINIGTNLISELTVLTHRRYQVHSCMSISEFIVYVGN
jgi:hypothetical protein